MRPPHRSQRSTSIAKTRASKRAHAMRRGLGAVEKAHSRPRACPVQFFEQLPWYFAGGSGFGSPGMRMKGPIWVDP